MAHRILGIDLGAYSVKVVIATPGLRQAHIAEFIERPVPPGDEPHELRAARVLGDIAREHKLAADTPFAAIAGDVLFIHVLEFGFRGLRRSDLEKAVGADLEDALPVDLEDMVFGFETLPDGLGADPAEAAGSDAERAAGHTGDPAFVSRPPPAARAPRGRVAAPTEGTRVLACAMEKTRARALLKLLDQHVGEARGLIASPAAYAQIAQHLAIAASRTSGKFTVKGLTRSEPIAVIDIGHERTDVCVVADNRPVFTRSIGRGGRQLTELIAREWGISEDKAAEAKHADGFIASRAEPAPTEDWQRISDVVVKELAPLAADIKRTLASCRAKTGATAIRLVIVGGGSRMRGLAGYLSEKIGIPTHTLTPAEVEHVVGSKLAAAGVPADAACLAAGTALEGGTGRPGFDLRQGELAYKADLSFLRAKAPQLLAAALAVMLFAVINGFAAHYKLESAEEALVTRHKFESLALFDEELTPDAVTAKIGVQAKPKSPLPKMSAYDVLLELNKTLPDKDKVQLEVDQIEIMQGQVKIDAFAQNNKEIDELEEALKKVECFKEISRGTTKQGANDTRQFSFTIKMNCM